MFSEAYATYLVHRTEWLKYHWDEYVVIAAYDVGGFYPTLADAYEAGRRRYGIGIFFLVLRIHESEQLDPIY